MQILLLLLHDVDIPGSRVTQTDFQKLFYFKSTNQNKNPMVVITLVYFKINHADQKYHTSICNVLPSEVISVTASVTHHFTAP